MGFHNGCLHLSGECLYWDKSVFVLGISFGMGSSYWMMSNNSITGI